MAFPGGDGPPCVMCGLVPEHYPTEAAAKEHRLMTQICPVCWHLTFRTPDADADELARIDSTMASYGLRMGENLGSVDWAKWTLRCRQCDAVVPRKVRKEHQCEVGTA